jgi:hypothetical protein
LIFARCEACARRDALAHQLVADHRGLSRRFGIDSAEHRLSCALDVLAILSLGSRPIRNPNPDTLSERQALALIRHLAIPGAACRWMSKFVPIMSADADTSTCSPSAWSHVRLSQRRAIRDGYAKLLRERVAASAPAVKISPPPIDKEDISPHNEAPIPAGCLFCGAATQTMSAVGVEKLGGRSAAAREVWKLHKIASEQLGGRPSPMILVGHLCKICDASVSFVGAVGASSLERALTASLCPDLIGKLAYGQLRLQGLQGWAVVAFENAETSPNERRWEHLPDLAELPSKLRSALGG